MASYEVNKAQLSYVLTKFIQFSSDRKPLTAETRRCNMQLHIDSSYTEEHCATFHSNKLGGCFEQQVINLTQSASLVQ